MSRPPVSVIVPFADDVAAGRRLVAALEALRTDPGDELIVVDNSRRPTIAVPNGGAVSAMRATGQRSSYYARNAGAATATNGWLLFTDADCTPPADLLDRYFDSPPDRRCGALAGEIVGDPRQEALAARWARARSRLGQRRSLEHRFRPYGSTANLLVRRAAFDDIHGFADGIRSGGDTDFCWRLQEAGWMIELRESAWTWHHHPETVRALLRQAFRYGGGQAWLERRHPGSIQASDGSAPRFLATTASRAASLALRGRFEEAGFCALDAASFLAEGAGHRSSNRASAG